MNDGEQKTDDCDKPALRMPSNVAAVKVPILTRRAPTIRSRSSISSGAVAMMGLAPSARVILAD